VSSPKRGWLAVVATAYRHDGWSRRAVEWRPGVVRSVTNGLVAVVRLADGSEVGRRRLPLDQVRWIPSSDLTQEPAVVLAELGAVAWASTEDARAVLVRYPTPEARARAEAVLALMRACGIA
jgi:hypothetical protein